MKNPSIIWDTLWLKNMEFRVYFEKFHCYYWFLKHCFGLCWRGYSSLFCYEDAVVVKSWHQLIEAKESCRGIGNLNLGSLHLEVFWMKMVV